MNPIHSRYILALSALAMLAPLRASAAESAPSPAKRPNIILCMTDDQGWGDVSYNGLKAIKTPNLDAMAAAGLRFDRFYAQHPSCSPTRASVMTGRHPYRMGTYWPGMPLRLQEMTIAQAVKQVGYTTAHFGKWHLSGGKPGMGRALKASDPLHPGHFGFDEWFTVSNWFDLDWTFSRMGEPVKVKGDGSDAIVAEALKFIEKSAKAEKPFFACVWYGSPHVPLKPLPDDLKAAGGKAYYGEIRGVDRSMGTLRKGLRDLGIADNTLVWFCSDNGAWMDDKAAPDEYGWNGGLRGHKGELWEGGIRVPAIIEWPAGIKKPAKTSVMACTSDVYPTLVELLGIKVPDQIQPLDGVSIMPAIRGETTERPRPLGFMHYGEHNMADGAMAWIDNRYKIYKQMPDRIQLFDLLADPWEKTDLAAEHPDIVRKMNGELETWAESVVRSGKGADYPGGLQAAPKMEN